MRTFAFITSSILLLQWLLAISSLAEGMRLTPDAVAVWGTLEQARMVLTNRDAFIAALSDFDRSARMKTNQSVSESEFLSFLGRNALAWSGAETSKLAKVCRSAAGKLTGWRLPLPATVLFVKTTGDEEGQAAHTRQNAIIIPRRMADDPEASLETMVLHELFHVMSRHAPDLKTNLYRVIGFRPIPHVDYPASLRQRKITNPDGFETGWFINVTNDHRLQAVIPVLYARQERYDMNRGGEFFNYMIFKLLVITNENQQWRPQLDGGRPRLSGVEEVQGYFEQIGKNTRYVIHPDEILADNFVKLVHGDTNLPSPWVVEGMRSVLRRHSP